MNVHLFLFFCQVLFIYFIFWDEASLKHVLYETFNPSQNTMKKTKMLRVITGYHFA